MTGSVPTPPSEPRRQPSALTILVSIVVGAAVLGFCIWAVIAAWNGAAAANPESHITGHGWAALIIAFVMVLVVGGGLMWLAFYSARKGYDDRAGGEE